MRRITLRARGVSGARTTVTTTIVAVSPISLPFEVRLRAPWPSHSWRIGPKNAVRRSRSFSAGRRAGQVIARRQQERDGRDAGHDQADQGHGEGTAGHRLVPQSLPPGCRNWRGVVAAGTASDLKTASLGSAALRPSRIRSTRSTVRLANGPAPGPQSTVIRCDQSDTWHRSTPSRPARLSARREAAARSHACPRWTSRTRPGSSACVSQSERSPNDR